MKRCTAVRKQGSIEPCLARALLGHTLCGRHARMKSPMMWVDANKPRTAPIVKAQAWVRGHLLRKRIRLAGPGVLHRENLANDEDLVTCTDKLRVSPLNYFAFEENGKIWWFEFLSLWNWAIRSYEPVNPYTKIRLTTDTRRRLRTMWTLRARNGVPNGNESTNSIERTRHQWNVLCQHFADYGFSGVHPALFHQFTRLELVSMFVLLERDIEVTIPITNPFRERILAVCRRRSDGAEVGNFSLQCVNSLLYILSLPSDPYILTFSILSAFYRS